MNYIEVFDEKHTMNKEKVLAMKPSAYRSMLMGKLKLTKSTSKKKKSLIRWNKGEEWLNLNALVIGKELPCGTKFKGQKDPTVCRPKIKADKHTPKPLAKDLTKSQIKKAIKIKKQGKRINWSKL